MTQLARWATGQAGAKAALIAVVLSFAAAMPAQALAHPGHYRGVVTSASTAGSDLHSRLYGSSNANSAASKSAGSNNLEYWGGPVMHADANYAIYWEPNNSSYSTPASYKSVINTYFSNVQSADGASSNDYSVATQYYDGSGSPTYNATFGGPIVDTDAYPVSGCSSSTGPCLTDAQIEAEVSKVASAHGLPTGLSAVYFMYTPPNVATCFDSSGSDCSDGGGNFDYCAYHSSFGSGSSTILYAVMPYADVPGCQSGEYPNGSPADATLNVTSHENIEALTDPLGSAWFDSSGEEVGDKCAWIFGSALGGGSGTLYNEQIGTNGYYLQEEWSNASSSCVQRMSATSTPMAAFTFSPSSPTAGQSVSFNPSGSTDTGGATITSYAWTFGDGATSKGETPSHAYASAGSYAVTLNVTDSNGRTSSVTHTVSVSQGASSLVASFTWSPANPVRRQSITFTSTSTDSGASITRYAWNFGDGRTATGSPVGHSYKNRGTYTITLTVTDSAGHTAKVTHTVTVAA